MLSEVLCKSVQLLLTFEWKPLRFHEVNKHQVKIFCYIKQQIIKNYWICYKFSIKINGDKLINYKIIPFIANNRCKYNHRIAVKSIKI